MYDLLGKRSFAQAGEDVIAASLIKKRKGIYVDFGAYHPKQFSNTYYFYKKGWRGVVIDPNQKMEAAFKRCRKRDVFVNLGVAGKKDIMEYILFDEAACNTFSAEVAEEYKKAGRKIRGKKEIGVMPLNIILDKYLPKGMPIDLLSVDVEGMDLEVLKSLDWENRLPSVVIAEDLNFDWRSSKSSEVVKLLVDLGYDLKGVTPYSLVFGLR